MKNQLLLIAIFFSVNSSFAQFVGTGSKTDSITVSEITKSAIKIACSERKVTVKGFVTEQIREDYYWYEDKTGKIKVEIEPKFMPSVPFDRNTELVINGEVCYPLVGRTYIGVKKITITGKKR